MSKSLIKRKIILASLLMLLVLPTLAYSEFFRWEDSDGKLHFTDSINNVPSEYRKGSNAELNYSGGFIQTASPTQAANGLSAPSVYKAFHRALRTEDYEEAKIHLSEKKLNTINTRWGGKLDEALRAMRSVTSRSIDIMNEEIGPEKARITVSGRSGRDISWGDIDLIKENGNWKIDAENWHGN